MIFYWEYYLLGIIVLPGILFGIIAEIRVHGTYSKFNQIAAQCGRTAGEVARMFLDFAGLSNIQIVRTRGSLNDYYHHKKQIIGLSEDTCDSYSISAIGVACHEVGHALQYKANYLPIKLRNFLIPITNFASRFIWIFIILGALFYYFSFSTTLMWIGVGIFGATTLLNLLTLPIEYNASKRALKLLQDSTVLTPEETNMARQVLNAAALTYVAALVISILELLRLIIYLLPFLKRRD